MIEICVIIQALLILWLYRKLSRIEVALTLADHYMREQLTINQDFLNITKTLNNNINKETV